MTTSEINLSSRRILITGSARGLGESFVRAALAAGATVCVSDVLTERGEALKYELATALARRVFFVSMDVSDPESIERAVSEAARLMGGIDGLVNNAAITNSGGKFMDELTLETWDRVMQVNVRGVWLVCKAARPWLAKSDAGRVVNIASDTALWGAPKLLAYVASKGAVIAMTRSLAREMGSDGIAVNAIAPGLTEVEATAYVPADRHAHYNNGRAIQRAQLPQDVDAAVLFLLTRASGFVTGQVLPVNGGFVMN